MNDDRGYVLRFRNDSGEDEYRAVTDFTISQYRCGLKEGDRIRLIRDLPNSDDDGSPTNDPYTAGQVWTVLSGSPQDPEALWLRRTDGDLYSWSDDDSIYDQFELIKRESN